jgi:hypothetical protein
MTTWRDPMPGKPGKVFIVAQFHIWASRAAKNRGLVPKSWEYIRSTAPDADRLRGVSRGHIWITTDKYGAPVVMSAQVRRELIMMYTLQPGLTWEGHEAMLEKTRLGHYRTKPPV